MALVACCRKQMVVLKPVFNARDLSSNVAATWKTQATLQPVHARKAVDVDWFEKNGTTRQAV